MIADLPPADESTAVPTHWLADRRLSLGARGVLVAVADATRWEPFDVPDLLDRLRAWSHPADRGYLDGWLRELSDAGYLIRDGRHYRLAGPEH